MRKELAARPLLIACLALSIGIASAGHPLVALLAIPLIWAGKNLTIKWVIIMIGAVGYTIAPKVADADSPLPGWIEGTAIVETVPELSSDGANCLVETKIGRLSLSWNGTPELSLGDQIEIAVPVHEAQEFRSEFFKRNGIKGTANGWKGRIVLLRPGPVWCRLATRCRSSFMSFAQASMSPRAASAIQALCFNVESRLSGEDVTNLRRSGTIHIISASGMHVLILAVALMAAFGMLPIPRWLQLIFLCIVLAFYGLATGLHPPIVRAIVMSAVMAFAYAVRREPDILSAVGFAGLLFLLWQPAALYDVGFQLSFVAIVGIALFFRTFSPTTQAPHHRLGSEMKMAAWMSLIATLATGPLVAYHFGQVSLVAVLANVMIALALPAMMIAALLAWSISGVALLAGAGVMGLVVEPLAGWILWTADSLGSPGWSAVAVPEFSSLWLLAYYGAALLLWRRRARQA